MTLVLGEPKGGGKAFFNKNYSETKTGSAPREAARFA